MIQWSIKGYHIYRRGPCAEIPLLPVPEPGNTYDSNGMKVMMPAVVEPELLEKVTRDGERRREPQRVQDILGKQSIGRVPANLCKVFKKSPVRWLCTRGQMPLQWKSCSTHPAPYSTRTERAKYHAGKDRAGRGVQLTSSYFVRVEEKDSTEVRQAFIKTCLKMISKITFD